MSLKIAPQYLSVGNGLLDVERASSESAYVLTQHSPNWFSPVHAPVTFDLKAESPQWLQFLDEALEGDVERITIIQEFFGYCLTGDTRFHKFLLVEGDGENGKSVLLDTLGSLLGPGNVSRVPLEVFGERFQLMATLGKLANIAPEVDNVRLSEGIVKQFVGGDPIYVDRKGLPAVQFRPTARLVVATNNRPTIADRSNGFWRRVLYVPFRVAVSAEKRDRYLTEKLRGELSGILNWALAGRRRLYRQDAFTESTLAKEAMQRYRATSNPEREFLTDCYEAGAASAFVEKEALYGHYKQWAEGQNYKPLDASNFAGEVRRVFPEATDSRPTVSGRRRRVWNGICSAEVAQEATSEPVAA